MKEKREPIIENRIISLDEIIVKKKDIRQRIKTLVNREKEIKRAKDILYSDLDSLVAKEKNQSLLNRDNPYYKQNSKLLSLYDKQYEIDKKE